MIEKDSIVNIYLLLSFTIYFANSFSLYFVFIIIWFTSKLANNTNYCHLGSGFHLLARTLYYWGLDHFSFVLIDGFYVVPASVKALITLVYI
jgi:hypothetical protein